MTVGRALRIGLGRGVGSPVLVFWVWLAGFALALPAAALLAGSLRHSIGASLMHEDLRRGFDMTWYGHFADRAQGVEATFTPSSVVGWGPFLDNLELWLGGGLFELDWSLVATGCLFALVWLLLQGGVLEQFARPGAPPGLGSLVRTGGRYFPRFLRLALLAAPCYYLIYRLGRWLFPWIERITRDVTSEGTVLAAYLAGAALVVLLLTLTRMSIDYARIAIVLEQRHSSLLAGLRGAGFVLTTPLRTLALYGTFAALGLVAMAVYGWLGPGTGQSSPLGVGLAFLAGQLFVGLRLALKLSLLGAELALYDGRRRIEVW